MRCESDMCFSTQIQIQAFPLPFVLVFIISFGLLSVEVISNVGLQVLPEKKKNNYYFKWISKLIVGKLILLCGVMCVYCVITLTGKLSIKKFRILFHIYTNGDYKKYIKMMIILRKT